MLLPRPPGFVSHLLSVSFISLAFRRVAVELSTRVLVQLFRLRSCRPQLLEVVRKTCVFAWRSFFSYLFFLVATKRLDAPRITVSRIRTWEHRCAILPDWSRVSARLVAACPYLALALLLFYLHPQRSMHSFFSSLCEQALVPADGRNITSSSTPSTTSPRHHRTNNSPPPSPFPPSPPSPPPSTNPPHTPNSHARRSSPTTSIPPPNPVPPHPPSALRLPRRQPQTGRGGRP